MRFKEKEEGKQSSEGFDLSEDEIFKAQKTGFLGGTPICKAEEYPDSKISLFLDGKVWGYVPMKGSRRDLIARKGEIHFGNYRRYEYQYIFGEYLGKRVARWMKKHKKITAYVTAGRYAGFYDMHQSKNPFCRRVRHGFLKEMFGDYPLSAIDDFYMEISIDKNFCFIWLYGLSEKKKTTIKKLISNL